MKVPSVQKAISQAIDSWPSLNNLAQFTMKRYGYGNTDRGFGVTYPNELDDSDKKIPEGFIKVYGFWGKPDGYEILIPETEYLTELAARLKSKGFKKNRPLSVT